MILMFVPLVHYSLHCTVVISEGLSPAQLANDLACARNNNAEGCFAAKGNVIVVRPCAAVRGRCGSAWSSSTREHFILANFRLTATSTQHSNERGIGGVPYQESRFRFKGISKLFDAHPDLMFRVLACVPAMAGVGGPAAGRAARRGGAICCVAAPAEAL